MDPGAVLLAPAPESFRGARSVTAVTPSFERRRADVVYWLINEQHDRLPAVFIDGASATTPAAAIIPFDADFAARMSAALRLWRIVTGRSRGRPPDRLTRQRRDRFRLTLRALDARLAHESYRVIAQTLFGHSRIPVGAAWKTHDLRDRTIRLARSGLKLMRGGYLELLRHSRTPRE